MFFAALLITCKMDMATGKTVTKVDSIDLSQYGTRLFGEPSKDVGLKVANWKENQNSGNPEELVNTEQGSVLDAREMDLIEKAMSSYHDNTCIRFVRKDSSHADYISIESDKSGCWSSVGRIGGRQADGGVDGESTKKGCLSSIGTVIHELMHACSFTHEQNREERDDYVKILRENMEIGTEHNFEKAATGTTSGFGTIYDYGSVMHYSDHAFSVNGKPTIQSKKKIDGKMGQREGFSKSDIEKLKKMYCKAHTASISNVLDNLIFNLGR